MLQFLEHNFKNMPFLSNEIFYLLRNSKYISRCCYAGGPFSPYLPRHQTQRAPLEALRASAKDLVVTGTTTARIFDVRRRHIF